MKAYFYEGKKYLSEQEVRNAIMRTERKIFSKAPKENEAEFWKKHNVILENYSASLDTLKSQKKARVKMGFTVWQSKANLISSLGFKIDANDKARNSIDDLLGTLQDGQTISFRDADNEYHDLTAEQLKTLKHEIAQNNIFAHEQKWNFEHQIAEARDVDALREVCIEYFGKDFS